MATMVAQPTETYQEAIVKIADLESQAKEHKRLSGVHRRRARAFQQKITRLREEYSRLGIDVQVAQTEKES